MSTYLKPQSPLYHKTEDAYFYPLTTADQIIMEDGSRLDEQVAVNSLSIDLNEIVNGTASPTNADMLGNVPAEEYARRMKLLWKNASPDSEFAAQDISISQMNNYDALVFTAHTNGIFRTSVMVDKTITTLELHTTQYISGVWVQFRSVSIDWDSGKISFGLGYENNKQENVRCIPLEIYGIKGVSE